jgi:hypothetical protein
MSPRRRTNHNSMGFVGVRFRPGGHFAAKSPQEECVCGSSHSIPRRRLPTHTTPHHGGLPDRATTCTSQKSGLYRKPRASLWSRNLSHGRIRGATDKGSGGLPSPKRMNGLCCNGRGTIPKTCHTCAHSGSRRRWRGERRG